MTTPRPKASTPAQIRTRVHDAIVELGELRSDDPDAEAAMRAVRLCRHTLECFWIPALDDLVESGDGQVVFHHDTR